MNNGRRHDFGNSRLEIIKIGINSVIYLNKSFDYIIYNKTV